MRKLVSLRTVSHIEPIKDADFIELAHIDGWQCVVKKNEFKEGDQGIYFEIDSFLPAGDPRFAFLQKQFISWQGHYGARIKTIKLKKVLSQGLLLPLSSFTEAELYSINDLETHLNIHKWEPVIPAQLEGEVFGLFPSFIKKTDQERIQNLSQETIEQEIHPYSFEVSIKLDGTSMTVFYKDGQFGVCSRNYHLKPSDTNTLWQVASRMRLEAALSALGRNLALQGELMGEGIQGNHEGLKGHHWFIFDIYDIDKQEYVTPYERYKILNQLLDLGAAPDLNHVPQWGNLHCSTYSTINTQTFLDMASGPSLHHTWREGLVFKRLDGQFSFKAISNEYLLKYHDR